MKKLFISLFIVVVVLLGLFCYAKYFWLGFYVPNGGSIVQIEKKSNGLDFNIAPMSTIYGVTSIKSEIDSSMHKIYVCIMKNLFGY